MDICKLFGAPLNEENKPNTSLSSPKKKNQADSTQNNASTTRLEKNNNEDIQMKQSNIDSIDLKMLKILNDLGKPKVTQQERKDIIHKLAALIQQKSVTQAKGTSLIKSNLENLC
jgi:hypothetical protein